MEPVAEILFTVTLMVLLVLEQATAFSVLVATRRYQVSAVSTPGSNVSVTIPVDVKLVPSVLDSQR